MAVVTAGAIEVALKAMEDGVRAARQRNPLNLRVLRRPVSLLRTLTRGTLLVVLWMPDALWLRMLHFHCLYD